MHLTSMLGTLSVLSVGQGGNGAFSPGKINKVIYSLGKSLVELNFGCHWDLMRRVEAFLIPSSFREKIPTAVTCYNSRYGFNG